MQGFIFQFNAEKSRAAVETLEGFSIISLIPEQEFNLRDAVEWSADEVLGLSKIWNLTQNRIADVIFVKHVPRKDQKVLQSYLGLII